MGARTAQALPLTRGLAVALRSTDVTTTLLVASSVAGLLYGRGLVV